MLENIFSRSNRDRNHVKTYPKILNAHPNNKTPSLLDSITRNETSILNLLRIVRRIKFEASLVKHSPVFLTTDIDKWKHVSNGK